ncbi:MAG: ATP-binding protein [Nocardioides sp.]
MGITVGTTTRRRLLLVVALTVAFTVFGLQSIPPPETPTEMWASFAGTFIWTSLVWDGRTRPDRELGLHLLAQWLIFVGIGLIFDWAPLDVLWMGATNVAGGLLMLVLFVRFNRGSGWALRTAASNLLLLGAAVVASTAVALLGGFPYLEVGQLDRLTLWWVIRNVVYAYVGGVTFLGYFHGERKSGAPAPRWAVVGLVPLGTVCVFATYQAPELPLTWFLLLPALIAGSILTPRGAAVYSLFVALLSALATLHPINQFGYDGFLPGSVIIDLLITASTFITIHLSILRLQRVTAASELDHQRRTAQEQATLLGTVFESMKDGLVILDPDSRVVLHNAAARQLIGKRIPVGEKIEWIAYLGLERLDGEPITPADLPGGRNADFQRQLVVRNEGADRVLDLGAWPLAGTEDRTVVLFSDVTAERERLTELTGFAGVVAHDLRGPLTSLHGWLELAEDSLGGDDTEKAREFLSRAQLSSVGMRQVIEDWLAYTVQRDGLLTRTDVSLGTLVGEIVASYGMDEAGVAPDFQVTADHRVEVDRVLVKQLLANLIGNAVKYTRPGEQPCVEIRSILDAEHGFVRIEVRDRGLGIPPGEEEQIFEEFHRAAAHADDYSGTGLGLSLCRRIVNRHGGSITARNNPDRGTTFSFTLPAG